MKLVEHRREILSNPARPGEALADQRDRAEVFLTDHVGYGREIVDPRELLSGTIESWDQERAIAGGAKGRALVCGDEPLMSAEAAEGLLMGVVGGRKVGHVVVCEDLITEVVCGAQHVLERRAAHGGGHAFPGGTDLVEDLAEGGSRLRGAGGARQIPRRATDDAVQELDVVGFVFCRLYSAAEVLSELFEEQRAFFLSAS